MSCHHIIKKPIGILIKNKLNTYFSELKKLLDLLKVPMRAYFADKWLSRRRSKPIFEKAFWRLLDNCISWRMSKPLKQNISKSFIWCHYNIKHIGKFWILQVATILQKLTTDATCYHFTEKIFLYMSMTFVTKLIGSLSLFLMINCLRTYPTLATSSAIASSTARLKMAHEAPLLTSSFAEFNSGTRIGMPPSSLN